jgi:hypothetical protein
MRTLVACPFMGGTASVPSDKSFGFHNTAKKWDGTEAVPP